VYVKELEISIGDFEVSVCEGVGNFNFEMWVL
jgi:hypothetical protein